MGLGSMMAGGNPADGRVEDDFYATPREGTQAVMTMLDLPPNSLVHEPCCGDGGMATVIKEYGHRVIGTDLVARGFGHKVDIFSIKRQIGKVVITNPPFSLAEDIIRHAMEHMQPDTLALLLKSTFFHAGERQALFDQYRPSMIALLPWRLDFKGLGRPTMECSWFIWTKGFTGYPVTRICPNLNPKKKRGH